MATTPEGKVKTQIKKVLKPFIDNGTMWAFWPVPYGYGKREIDCIGCHLGEFFAIEAKAHGKEPTALQELTIGSMRKARGKVFVIDGQDTMQPLVDWLYRKPRML